MEPRQADVSIPLQSSGWGAAAPGPCSEPQPRDYALWALGRIFPLQLQARDRKVSGDVEAARHFSSKARCYNALATAGSVVLPLLLGALIVTGVIHLSKLAQESVGFFTYQFSGSDDEDQ
ncbi:interferon-induced transmembrane protein 5 [Geospiza fortis]|uniref:Interferon-induced transmembrane protein 5 n=1 Tax=Geospiza fortis TaxID=48883 RepID=A0A8N5EU95_GEOFO|nr:interferon-induced transmembrane protein 5 [Geospiza fortis]